MQAQAERTSEIVGVFNTFDHMQEAINDLETAGFSRSQISILGSEEDIKNTFGTTDISHKTLQDHPLTPRAANIAQDELGIGQGVLVGGGIIAGVVAAIAAVGGIVAPSAGIITIAAGGVSGAAVGSVMAKLLGDKYADFFQQQITEGGLIIWVSTPTISNELLAMDILTKHHAHHIHKHDALNTKERAHHYAVNAELFSSLSKDLKEVKTTHHSLIANDNIMQEKFNHVEHTINIKSLTDQPVSAKSTQNILTEMDDIILHAKDMAEEEQRMAEEGPHNAPSSKTNIENYFKLALRLESITQDYKEKMYKISA